MNEKLGNGKMVKSEEKNFGKFFDEEDLFPLEEAAITTLDLSLLQKPVLRFLN
jgi:hypothetical protein